MESQRPTEVDLQNTQTYEKFSYLNYNQAKQIPVSICTTSSNNKSTDQSSIN